ncbi:hypothetical protein BOTBODRAFT_149628 [Botryobasidium botryosum FD-172 SS1]|uniref:Uncharacterized protein n=1 Tax=Botryobasidium botryosum (strain FD-172 SS1) TaxID=930990 RepID=A0A067LTG7_BOTB1|nr:hypothetical protein BOTBODRAFT_149628 [Botryobasidium botryosum FD-172 SS1]
MIGGDAEAWRPAATDKISAREYSQALHKSASLESSERKPMDIIRSFLEGIPTSISHREWDHREVPLMFGEPSHQFGPPQVESRQRPGLTRARISSASVVPDNGGGLYGMSIGPPSYQAQGAWTGMLVAVGASWSLAPNNIGSPPICSEQNYGRIARIKFCSNVAFGEAVVFAENYGMSHFAHGLKNVLWELPGSGRPQNGESPVSAATRSGVSEMTCAHHDPDLTGAGQLNSSPTRVQYYTKLLPDICWAVPTRPGTSGKAVVDLAMGGAFLNFGGCS